MAIEPLGRARTGGAAHWELKGDGGAEPRLTSGGKAGVDGVKFTIRRLIFKTVSHIGGEAGGTSQVLGSGLDFNQIPDRLLILKAASHIGGEPE